MAHYRRAAAKRTPGDPPKRRDVDTQHRQLRRRELARVRHRRTRRRPRAQPSAVARRGSARSARLDDRPQRCAEAVSERRHEPRAFGRGLVHAERGRCRGGGGLLVFERGVVRHAEDERQAQELDTALGAQKVRDRLHGCRVLHAQASHRAR